MLGTLRQLHHWAGRPEWIERNYARVARRRDYVPGPWLDAVAARCGGLEGRRVLEVGCDPQGRFVSQVQQRHRPAEIVGMNLVAPDLELEAGCRLEPGDIRQTGYDDGAFDVILSSSAFEHIANFDTALSEMHRILAPGGRLFSHFGPIWSTSYGHHLWLHHDGQLYNYWNVALPAYCHLLMTREEVSEELARTHPAAVCDVITEYVFASPEQNHLFFEDYETIVADSDFDVLFFKGYDNPKLAHRYNASIGPDTYRRLRDAYPTNRHFSYDGITLLLEKPGL